MSELTKVGEKFTAQEKDLLANVLEICYKDRIIIGRFDQAEVVKKLLKLLKA